MLRITDMQYALMFLFRKEFTLEEICFHINNSNEVLTQIIIFLFLPRSDIYNAYKNEFY